ncbi:MAG TPA: helix-turn-helix domain-containing protein [Solirubrobacteraceae bacterium]|jgi:DNA-binding HxlR family transcriptional regulator|nr:helix-turn-helix domain-containing protein [Solirubrobacteraceae bacterium]
MSRTYDQHCSLAHALDLVGERWTLLIVRELLAGPRRYTDLLEGLVSVPTNVLAARLREMQANDLVRKRRLEAPANAVSVYELTEHGQALGAAVTELARWGLRTLPSTTQGRPFKAHWLVLALRARFDASAARGIAESYEFRIPGEEPVCLEVSDGAGRARIGAAAEPAVRVTADADTLVALGSGAITADGAVERGGIVEGSAQAIDRMRSILPADPA